MGTGIKIINTSIHLLILFSIAFLFLSIAVCLHKVHELSDESVSLDQGYIYISIQHESNPLVLDNTTNTLDGFRSLYNLLSSSGYTYYEIYRQPLDCSGSCYEFYDADTFELSSFCKQALCVQISQNVQRDFDLELLSGTMFGSNDFQHSESKKIPVILGYNYVSLYKQGDTFTASYLYSPFEFEVIGFLNESSDIFLSTGNIALNNYIIIPSIDFEDLPMSDESYVTQKIHYANKTSGKIKVKEEDFSKAYAFVQKMLSASSVGEYSVASSSLEQYFLSNGFNIKIIIVICYLISMVSSFIELIYIQQNLAMKGDYKIRPLGVMFLILLIVAAFTISLIPTKFLFAYFGFARFITPQLTIFLGIIVIVNTIALLPLKSR